MRIVLSVVLPLILSTLLYFAYAWVQRRRGIAVAMQTSDGAKTYEFGPQFKVKPVPDFFAEVKALLGESAVV